MLLLHARHLLAQAFVDEAQRILRRRIGGAVVDGVDAEEQILAGEIVIEARGAEVLADILFRMAEGLGDSAAEFRAVGHRPKRQQRFDGRIHANILLRARGVGEIALARLVVRYQGHGAQAPVLPEALVVAEEEELVLPNRAAQRAAELVALKFGNRSGVEVVAGIESAVADELKCRAVELDWFRRW